MRVSVAAAEQALRQEMRQGAEQQAAIGWVSTSDRLGQDVRSAVPVRQIGWVSPSESGGRGGWG
jgi:hypothetical protein